MDEHDRHVQVAHGVPFRGSTAVPDGNLVHSQQQQLPHAAIDHQQVPFGDMMMHNEYLPTDSTHTNGNGLKANGTADSRNVLLAMTMNNPHSLTDPSIQETLSPFFQPFGVDVSHLPMTNPPIFQSSLTRYDEPVRRRRISISNGQISQLGEDLETVENLYNTQPPPLPPRFDQQHAAKPFFESSSVSGENSKNVLIHIQDNGEGTQGHSNVLPTIPPWQSNNPVKEEEPKSLASLLQDNQGPLSTNGNPDPLPTAELSRNTSTSSSSSQFQGYQGQYGSNRMEPMPGTNAWKRARLLERNRIAASKCRQRKKVAQLQLQQEFDVMSKENRMMRKKLDYYEKLVLKFKRFSEAHMKKCTDMQSFSIIEEMLMIDSGIREVDKDGLVVKIEEK